MKIVFFNRFFHPDTSATSQILSDLAFHLAAEGVNVEVVTSRPSKDLPVIRVERGVRVHAVSVSPVGSHSLVARALGYLRYYLSARNAARRVLQPGDIAVVMTDPPMLLVAIVGAAKERSAQTILWMQDLFPEVAIEHGIPALSGVIGRCLKAVRNRSMRAADSIVPISHGMAQRLESEGATIEPGAIIPNWANKSIVPMDTSGLEEDWGLQSKFVVGYSGNLGRVHEFDTMIDAARLLRHVSDINFLFVGKGPRLEEVQARTRDLGLPNVTFRPHQPLEVLPSVMAVADVHLCTLRPAFEGLVFPSKVYGILAAGKPTIFVGSTTGDVASTLEAGCCGISVQTGDAVALAKSILDLRRDEGTRISMGRCARELFEREYQPAIAMARWTEILKRAASRPNR